MYLDMYEHSLAKLVGSVVATGPHSRLDVAVDSFQCLNKSSCISSLNWYTELEDRIRRHGVENPNPLLNERHRSHRLRGALLINQSHHLRPDKGHELASTTSAKRNWKR